LTDSQTWKYGDNNVVSQYISMQGITPEDDLVENALIAADVHIDSTIELNKLPLPDPDSSFPNTLIQCANMYATAQVLQPQLKNNEGKQLNTNVLFYMEQADSFLSNYIKLELENANQNNQVNPYSNSKSPRTRNPLEPIIDPFFKDDLERLDL
jgi:hypothetical protein